ncbi:MAG: CRISPR-associated protein Cas5, partial [Aggregatilineales bacterium]
PYFVQGVQPTYEMPPPATLYGHVCSALGDPAPAPFRVALHFTFGATFTDYEHTHLFGREPKLSPFVRELLVRPRLTLYLDRPEWLTAFQRPKYVVTLGRSQDLMKYTDVRIVTLAATKNAYVEHTLLPLRDRSHFQARVEGLTALTMPRFLDRQRRVTWGQYAMVKRRQALLPGDSANWIDPHTELWREAQRAVVWLSYPSGAPAA